uniref:BZIP domain-containing protein n=1 Tax=Rhabditophanes sp. KR3021 TaxID=114890 RepID=A0AC35U2Q2_9BILA
MNNQGTSQHYQNEYCGANGSENYFYDDYYISSDYRSNPMIYYNDNQFDHNNLNQFSNYNNNQVCRQDNYPIYNEKQPSTLNFNQFNCSNETQINYYNSDSQYNYSNDQYNLSNINQIDNTNNAKQFNSDVNKFNYFNQNQTKINYPNEYSSDDMPVNYNYNNTCETSQLSESSKMYINKSNSDEEKLSFHNQVYYGNFNNTGHKESYGQEYSQVYNISTNNNNIMLYQNYFTQSNDMEVINDSYPISKIPNLENGCLPILNNDMSYENQNIEFPRCDKELMRRFKKNEYSRNRYHRMSEENKKKINSKRAERMRKSRQREKILYQLYKISEATGDIIDDETMAEIDEIRKKRSHRAEVTRQKYASISIEERKLISSTQERRRYVRIRNNIP